MKRSTLALIATLASGLAVAAPELNLAGQWSVQLSDNSTHAVTLPGTLSDAKLGPAATKAVYGALTPRHQYVGNAVYTKTFTVTPEMSGDYELFLERVAFRFRARGNHDFRECRAVLAAFVDGDARDAAAADDESFSHDIGSSFGWIEVERCQ